MEIVKQNQISKGIEPEKLAYIDLMRGIAIVMVLIVHTGVYLVSTICISVVIAYFTQKFIEQPFIKVGKRVTLKLR